MYDLSIFFSRQNNKQIYRVNFITSLQFTTPYTLASGNRTRDQVRILPFEAQSGNTWQACSFGAVALEPVTRTGMSRTLLDRLASGHLSDGSKMSDRLQNPVNPSGIFVKSKLILPVSRSTRSWSQFYGSVLEVIYGQKPRRVKYTKIYIKCCLYEVKFNSTISICSCEINICP
jgi:hypothetical protein